ncbi:MAG: hypothetical protein LBU51_01080, partial [Bacteroidales bacterium]|nr:hypothetical protein [Bacteroidales bacterium]
SLQEKINFLTEKNKKYEDQLNDQHILLKKNKELLEIARNQEPVYSENEHIIKIDPLNWLILKHVAKREGEKRNQDWSPDDVINYFVHSRFEIGNLNGDLQSLNDNEIKNLKKQIPCLD